jgi:two-component system, OmpR family, alkaline phosphatase synthesis response regulator PhoP
MKHIVMCDDELPILRAAEIKLTRAGFRVTCCNDGQEALEAIARERPDMLLTDCQMPRLSGLELIERLRSQPETVDLPIMMLTGKGLELPADELREKWGVLAVIAKPMIESVLATEAV